jgi:putative acetyltransferase
MRITPGDLHYHLTNSHAYSGPGSSHALDLKGLQSPDITDAHRPSRARNGIGSAMLGHIISIARSRGISRLSLETGSLDYFRPAVSFYRKHGFIECPPFAEYVPDPNSIFLTLDLRTQ